MFGTSLGLVRNSSMQCTGGSVKYTYDPPGTAPVPGVEYSLAVQASLIVLQSYNASAPTYTPCAAPNLSSNPTVFITGLGHEDDCRVRLGARLHGMVARWTGSVGNGPRDCARSPGPRPARPSWPLPWRPPPMQARTHWRSRALEARQREYAAPAPTCASDSRRQT